MVAFEFGFSQWSFDVAHRLRPNPFKDHGVGITQGTVLLFLGAHRPSEERQPEHGLRYKWRHRGQGPDIVGDEVGPCEGRGKKVPHGKTLDESQLRPVVLMVKALGD